MHEFESLSSDKIAQLLSRDGVSVIVYDTVDSTNNEAKRLISKGSVREAVILSEQQTSGRGRQGKSFYSPRGSGLYMTAVLRPIGELCDFTLITSAAAVAVAEAIEQLCGIYAQIKWVNDICICGKKAVGILTEAVSSGGENAVIVGIGVNITTEAFPKELADKACSLAENASDITSRNALAAEISVRLFSLCDKLPSDRGYMQRYRSRSCVIGRRIVFTENGFEYAASADDIDDGGRLLVTLSSGEKRALCGGEISVKPV